MPTRPKSAALAQLSGNAKKLSGELLVREAEPPMPTGLSVVGKEKWIQLMQVLSENGQLNTNDAELYEMFVAQWEIFKKCMKSVRQDGVVQNARKGRGRIFRRNPSVQLAIAATKELRALCEDLGLSPTGRAKLGIAAAIRATQNPAYEHLK